MKRGNYRDVDSLACKDLLGYDRGKSMRYGIMYVQDIKLFISYHIHYFADKRRFVWGVFKQRVVHHVYLVEIDIAANGIQPYREACADKMDFVIFLCQCLTKFRCHYPATPVSRVAYHADLHFFIISF